MPRKARLKSGESVYHIICRSVSEFLLFREDEDKDYYLGLIKRYKDKYKCSLYAYCLMDNHLHLHLDPKGYDISKIMQCLNLAYVRYYNMKYKRHGPVFQDRFESRILDSEEYNITVSAYIHNNPKDIELYNGREEEYPYSSMGIYLGLRSDTLGLIDTSFMMELFNARSKERFKERYREYVTQQRDMGSTKVKELAKARENQYISGRRIILREQLPGMVVSYISDKLMKNKESLTMKSKKRTMEYRAICSYAMRVLCCMGYKQICENMYNMTVSGCSRLCNKGYELISSNMEYGRIIDELTKMSA